MNDELLDQNPEVITNDIRSRNLFAKLGIETVRDLIKHTAEELLDIKNYGPGSLRILERDLARHGLAMARRKCEFCSSAMPSSVSPTSSTGESLLYHYRCRVLRVVDGDTLDVEIDLGFRMTRQERIRLLGVNCPEMNTAEGKAARDAAVGWLSKGVDWVAAMRLAHPPFLLHTSKGDSFGRWLGVIENTKIGETLNDYLVASGHAVRTDERGK